MTSGTDVSTVELPIIQSVETFLDGKTGGCRLASVAGWPTVAVRRVSRSRMSLVIERLVPCGFLKAEIGSQ